MSMRTSRRDHGSSSPPVAECRLCQRLDELRWSHIIPAWVYRRVHKTGDPASPTPIQVSDGVAIAKPHQAAEYMLCDECEDALHHDETYVANVSLQEDGAFPALASLKAIETKMPGVRVADAASLEIHALARFGASVVWRASESRRFDVRLGSYGVEFASYLRGESGFPSRARLVLSVIDAPPKPGIARVVFGPDSQRGDGFHAHRFACFGLDFVLYVGGEPPPIVEDHCLLRTARVLVTDGRDHLGSVVQTLREAERKGKFGRIYGTSGRPKSRT